MYRYIVAMARSRQEIKNRLADASEEIDLHIMKLIFMSDSKDVMHWKQEIHSFLNKIDRFKGSNKAPDAKFIFDALACHNDIIDSFKILLEEDYPQVNADRVNNRYIVKALEEYQLFAADQLSRQLVLRRHDVYAVLDDIIERYGINK